MKIGAVVMGNSPKLERCVWELETLPENVEVRVTQGPGDAVQLARDLAPACDLIIACGGDGTFNECVNGLVQSNSNHCSIAVYPIGSANDYHRLTGGDTIAQLFASALAGRIEQVDLMQVKTSEKSAIITNMSACGIGAEIGKTVNDRRTQVPAAMNYYSAIVQWLTKYEAPTLEITTDADRWQTQCFLAGVGKGKFAGNGLALTPQAVLNDGLLALTVIEKVGVVDFLRYQTPLKKGRFIDDPRVSYRQSSRVGIRVLEGNLAVDLNGDFFARIAEGQQVDFEVLPAALQLVVSSQDLVLKRKPA